MFEKIKAKRGPETTMSRSQNEVITSIIGEDLEIQGNLSSKTTIRVDGKVSGDVEAQSLIIVGEKAQIKGNLKGKSVLVHGFVTGDVQCSELSIKKTGQIIGQMKVETIEIEVGGKYNCTLSMGSIADTEKIISLDKGKKQA